MAKTAMKRSRTAKKTSHKGKKFYKGMRSKTMKNKKDFTTKKSSKVFHRKSHYEKHAKGSTAVRRPYHKSKKGGYGVVDYYMVT